MKKIVTYDSTLRDGEQAKGVTLSLEDKLLIARRLDSFGIDIIEGGFPSSNPKDTAFFRELCEHPLKHARLAAFGSTCRKGMPACKDQGLADLLKCGASVVAVVGKVWDVQVEHVLQTTHDENLRMIRDSIAFLKAEGREVVFDAEHFFDAFKANPGYALECLREAAEAGADSLDLCDTNGGALPFEIAEITEMTIDMLTKHQTVSSHMSNSAGERVLPRIGIHCHDDSGCAVANTLAAVRAGATQVQGTINGYGERVGNANLLTVIANLELKMGIRCVGAEKLRELTNVASYIAEVCNFSIWTHAPYVGASAFTHKGGLHASATARYSEAYEHISPELVGNRASMVVSELAGKASLVAKAAALGINLAAHEDAIQPLLDEIKEREAQGYSYEIADGSLALLIARRLGISKSHFTLESFRVIVDDRENAGALAKDAQSEATIKVCVGDERYVATGEGVGPVSALSNALKLALRKAYPQVLDMHLVDFKVRLLDESTGTDAITRVVITTQKGDDIWGTIGVSENIIEASWNALVESLEYGLERIGA